MSSNTNQHGAILVERSTACVLNPLIDHDRAGETLDNVAELVDLMGQSCAAIPRMSGGTLVGIDRLCMMIQAALRYERQFL